MYYFFIQGGRATRGFIETPEKKKAARKRQINTECRKKVKAQHRRNLGHGYTTTKGKTQIPRTLGPPCSCKKKCRELLHGVEMAIFQSFWDLQTFDKQNAYLFGTIKSVGKKRVYPKKTKRQTSSRSTTFRYFVKINGKDQEVCKQEFLSIHGLQNSKRRVYNICTQINQGLHTPKSDGRGRHKNRKNRLPEETIQSIHDHIKAIPKYRSHYSRERNPQKCYIDHDISISSLYKKYYIPWCQERNIIPAKEDRYRRIFCSEYNIGFKLPKSDTCATCDEYNTLLDTHKGDENKLKEIKTNLDLHQRRAEAMQTNMKNEIQRSKNENDLEVICFDLQQALPIPQLTVGKAFYLRKIWMYNLGIYDGKTGKSYMNMWTEDVAKRGSDEIASCILKYIKEHPPTPNKHLIVFTDNCGGQNKNWTIMALWLHLVRTKVYKSIEHRFLVAGHTHLPCDRDFAAIEKHKKYLGQVYSPECWVEAVKDSKIQNPFTVYRINQNDIFSFEKISKSLSKKKLTDEKENVDFSKVRCFKFEESHHNTMFIKHFLNEAFKAVNIGKRGQKIQIEELNALEKKYVGPVPINAKKLANLKVLLPYIPGVYHNYYASVGVKTTANEIDDDGEDQEGGVENIDGDSESD